MSARIRSLVLSALLVSAIALGGPAVAYAATGIQGTVTDAHTGDPVQGITALYRPASSPNYVAGTSTASDGTYTLATPAGDFIVLFVDWNNYYFAKTWPSCPNLYGYGTTITVAPDTLVTANATMGPGAVIDVHLSTEATGGPVATDSFYTHDLFWDCWEGHWALQEHMRPGSYGVAPYVPSDSPIFGQFLPGDPSYKLPNGSDKVMFADLTTVTVDLPMRHDPSFYKDVLRKAGSSRYDTALELAREGWGGWTNGNLVVASGEDRSIVDALSASGLAGAYQAPLLLVRYGSVPTNVRNAIAAMNPGLKVHIVGGTGSVSAAVQTALKSIPSVASVDRCAGSDRYQTAAQVARWVHVAVGGYQVLFANGEDPAHFYDALALSPVAYARQCPIMLTRKYSAPATTTAVMYELGLNDRYLAGGPGSVTEPTRIALGVSAGDRLYGATRFGTAIAIATRARKQGWLQTTYPMVYGVAATLPDALAAGPMAGRYLGPLLLTGAGTPVVSAETRSFLTSAGVVPSLGYGFVIGGTGVIPESARLGLMSTLNP